MSKEIKETNKYVRFSKVEEGQIKKEIKLKGKCVKCKKPMFKNRKCKYCLKKGRLKRKANSRGKSKDTWSEYK